MSNFYKVVTVLMGLGNILRLGTGTRFKGCNSVEWGTRGDYNGTNRVHGGDEVEDDHTQTSVHVCQASPSKGGLVTGKMIDGLCNIINTYGDIEQFNVSKMGYLFNNTNDFKLEWIRTSAYKPLPLNALVTGSGTNGGAYYTGRCVYPYPGAKPESFNVGSIGGGGDNWRALEIILSTKFGQSIFKCLKYDVLVCDPK